MVKGLPDRRSILWRYVGSTCRGQGAGPGKIEKLDLTPATAWGRVGRKDCRGGNSGEEKRAYMLNPEAPGVLENLQSSVGRLPRCRTHDWRDDRISVSQKRKQNSG